MMGTAEENSAAFMLAVTALTTSILLTSAAKYQLRHVAMGRRWESTSCATAARRHAFHPQCRCATNRGGVGWPRVAQPHGVSRANRRRSLVTFKQMLRPRGWFNDNAQRNFPVTSESQESIVPLLMVYTMDVEVRPTWKRADAPIVSWSPCGPKQRPTPCLRNGPQLLSGLTLPPVQEPVIRQS